MTNRLADSTSPYLLQHAGNPVHWQEWGPEAFAEARERGVPVLLSIGYAACHWCHVMAHESFEDEATAAVMNAGFVCVKVDREERPDVDAVYMEATQAMTGSGGWPMTAFLTDKGEPFYCGTYFPTSDRHGLPGFTRLLRSITESWAERRAEIEAGGADVVRRLSERATPPGAQAAPLTAALLDTAAATLAAALDTTPSAFGGAARGGFGGAPKFPPSMALEFLLRHHARTGSAPALAAVEATCEAMARGGMYDQLAGGFARYAVDADWVVPHFEKMLYDNALLARVYLHWWRATGSPLARRVAEETCDWMLRDLLTEQGGFASALDADTDGVEGLTYAWTPAQLVEVLGADDGAWAAELLAVTDAGTFEHGSSTLQLRSDPDDAGRWATVRAQLLAARDARPQPARDGKVVTAWNGLAIAALAEAGVLLSRPDLLAAAVRCADLLADLHWDATAQRVLRTSIDGRAGRHAGVLEDYADLAEGLLALFAATGDPGRLDGADHVLRVVLEQFVDGAGGFYDTAHDAEELVRRPQDPTDGATPSGASAAAGALLAHAALTGSAAHRDAAEAAVAQVAPLAGRMPRFAGWALAVGEAAVAGPLEIAVVGAPGSALHRAALASTSPGAVVCVGEPDAAGVPLLAHRPRVAGADAAYVCRQFTCRAPVTTVEALAAAVSAAPPAG